jgi:hypothetical protein
MVPTTAQRVVDNPLAGPSSLPHERKIVVTVNLRESPVEWWRHCGDIGEEQYAAATRLRAAYERLELGGAKAFDISKPFVDGSTGGGDPMTETRRRAGLLLVDAQRALGPYTYDVVRTVVGERVFPKDLAPGDPQQAKLIAYRVRQALADLAAHWSIRRRRA